MAKDTIVVSAPGPVQSKVAIGLDNVDNTADSAKPVSIAQAAADAAVLASARASSKRAFAVRSGNAPLLVQTPITITKGGTITITGHDTLTGTYHGINTANGHFVTSTDLTTWTDRTYSPVTYTATGAGAAEFDETYMYATHVNTGRIWRAVKGAWNAWTEISVSDRGALANNRPGSLCPLGSGVLLWGNYTSGNDAGSYIWRSTDAGASWTKVLSNNSGKHIHAIRKAPDGSIWASVGDAGFEGTGLWKSTDNGVTWTQMSTNDYGIDMVFTPETESMPAMVVLEGDGLNRPLLMGFPLDGSPGDDTIPLVWYSGAPADSQSTRATTRGIGLTPNKDVLFWTTTESGTVGSKAGLYISPAPFYDTAILLADNTGAEPVAYTPTFMTATKCQLTSWTFTLPTFATY